MASKAKILVVDDEKPTRDVMARILSAAGYETLTAPDADAAMKVVASVPDLALLVTDYKMPGENGVELIRKAKAANPLLACILITAFGEIELAVEAMKDGADDFLTKPVTDLKQMELRVAKAIEKNALARKSDALEHQVEELRSRLGSKQGLESFTGSSPAMERVYALIRQAAKSSANVLVEGPSGTGKELVAKALHDLSPRAKGPFVAVECAALSPTLLESELFGHEKGAFTDAYRQRIGRFEAADGGTLFLDEITEIDLATQVKLLRVLETRRFQRVGGTEEIPSDFRLVAATNRDLAAYVREGRFREDLYYRLNVIDIRLPALRDRPGDIALLVSRFVKEFSAANGGAVTGIDHEAMRALEAYDWPGNVRQLRNAVERMVVLSQGGRLGIDDVPPDIVSSASAQAPSAPAAPRAAVPSIQLQPPASAPVAVAAGANRTLADTEQEVILAEIAACRNNKTKAAERLGISRRTLHRKLKAWGIES
ncbi:MAG: sigma-54-dependent Fis family transcriptional regulator [Lentisphaerae bacterium]|nr:sigma-54-dependent Fis family transcriptional regulator [Lentisphaerota bacterium]